MEYPEYRLSTSYFLIHFRGLCRICSFYHRARYSFLNDAAGSPWTHNLNSLCGWEGCWLSVTTTQAGPTLSDLPSWVTEYFRTPKQRRFILRDAIWPDVTKRHLYMGSKFTGRPLQGPMLGLIKFAPIKETEDQSPGHTLSWTLVMKRTALLVAWHVVIQEYLEIRNLSPLFIRTKLQTSIYKRTRDWSTRTNASVKTTWTYPTVHQSITNSIFCLCFVHRTSLWNSNTTVLCQTSVSKGAFHASQSSKAQSDPFWPLSPW